MFINNCFFNCCCIHNCIVSSKFSIYISNIGIVQKSFQNYKQDHQVMDTVNIKDKLDRISEYWKPVIVGELNHQQVRLVKIKGEFVMHKHDHEDELFLVLKGLMQMDYGDRIVDVHEGEFIIVPKGVKHRPIANDEAHLLLFEPATVINTGDVRNELTHDSPERI